MTELIALPRPLPATLSVPAPMNAGPPKVARVDVIAISPHPKPPGPHGSYICDALVILRERLDGAPAGTPVPAPAWYLEFDEIDP